CEHGAKRRSCPKQPLELRAKWGWKACSGPRSRGHRAQSASDRVQRMDSRVSDRAGVNRSATERRGAPLLAVKDVGVRFGGIVALDGISFDLPEGELLGLIGPNGAGKTTLFNCLSRIYNPAKGDILFDGVSILDKPAHMITEIGIART